MTPPPLPEPTETKPTPITTEELLAEARTALRSCEDFLNSLNGRVSYEVWCDSYQAHKGLADFRKKFRAAGPKG